MNTQTQFAEPSLMHEINTTSIREILKEGRKVDYHEIEIEYEVLQNSCEYCCKDQYTDTFSTDENDLERDFNRTGDIKDLIIDEINDFSDCSRFYLYKSNITIKSVKFNLYN